MHIFVNGKELANALSEFKRAGIKEAIIRATPSHSIELSGFVHPVESRGTVVQLWVSVPLSREADAAACDPVMVQLKELRGMLTEEVEIEADCFGLFVNQARHYKGLAECPRDFDGDIPGIGWDNGLAVNVKPEDCRAIAWVLRAIGRTDGLCERGFDRLCIRSGIAEATDGNRAHRASVSCGVPEMLVPAVMADLMSRQPGALNFRTDEDQEYAEYQAGSIRMETVRKKGDAWPDFARIMPYNAPSVVLHGEHVLKRVRAAVEGYKAATVRLSAGKGKRNLIIDGIDIKAPMKPPFDYLVKTGETRRETAVLEEPCPFENFGMGAEYNAAFITDALAGFVGYANMHYTDEAAPLMLADGTGRAALIMSLF